MPRARKPPAVVSAIRSAIARAAWGKLSADERKARQQRVWAKRKAADELPHASDCARWVNEPCDCVTGKPA